MAVVPQILQGVQPVVRTAGVDVGAIGVGEDTAYGLVVGFSGRAIEGGICAIRNEGERRFGSDGRHLRKSKTVSIGEI